MILKKIMMGQVKMPISINLSKAKGITKARLRVERSPLLEEQDILYMRAQEASADTSAIVAEKQRLRDITKSVDDCTELEQLSALQCVKPG